MRSVPPHGATLRILVFQPLFLSNANPIPAVG